MMEDVSVRLFFEVVVGGLDFSVGCCLFVCCVVFKLLGI